MTKTIKELIASRKAEITSQINDLKKELASIKVAEVAITESDDSGVIPKKRNYGRLIIKDMVIGILYQTPQKRADAHEILKGLKEAYNKEILRESLSPQLSRLKAEGYLTLEGNDWCLTEKALIIANTKEPEGIDAMLIDLI